MIAATDGGAGRGSRAYRMAMWVGHYEPDATPVFYAVILGQVACGLWLPVSVNVITSGVAAPVLLLFIVAMLCSDFVHGRNLCPRDFDDTLLDPQGAVDKNMRRLAWIHRPKVRLVHAVAAFVVISILMISSLAYGWPWPIRAVMMVVAIAGVTLAGYTSVAIRTHRRLHPWCPLCRRRGGGGGGGSGSRVPDPQPVNTNAR